LATPDSLSSDSILKSRDMRQKSQGLKPTKLTMYGEGSIEDEDDEGNVFDTLNQGPFLAN
jgi:hypothetical protein